MGDTPHTRTTCATSLLAGAAVAYVVLQALGRAAGTTAAERRSRLPGDDVVPAPQLVTDHAVTIEASADQVWPWLTQMGWHRGGWYTPRWVDRLLFPANWPSADALGPELVRDLQVGDVIPDGPPGTAEYVVVEVDAPHALVLRSTTHVPPGWRERFGADIVWTWSFLLTDLRDSRTRVHQRVRGYMSPWWFAALYRATIVPADFVMGPGMLHGLKRRAPVRPAGSPAGRSTAGGAGRRRTPTAPAGARRHRVDLPARRRRAGG